MQALSTSSASNRMTSYLYASSSKPQCWLGHAPRARQVKCAATSAPSVATHVHSKRTSFHHGITYTSYEANTFAIKFNTTGVRVLVDPWLVGELNYGDNSQWLYRGRKRAIGRTVKVDLDELAAETDVIILTQGLDDHTHIPTLSALPKTVPVVACPQAAERIQALGFKDLTVLDSGDSAQVAGGRLTVSATGGAQTGPPWSARQIGVVIREQPAAPPVAHGHVAAPPPSPEQQQAHGGGDSSQAGTAPEQRQAPEAGASVYYEPHCDFDGASVARTGPVDVVISPVTSTVLSLGPASLPLVRGEENVVDLLKLLQPKVLVPLLNSELDSEGALAAFIKEKGSLAELRARLQSEGVECKIEVPAPPGESLAIAL